MKFHQCGEVHFEFELIFAMMPWLGERGHVLVVSEVNENERKILEPKTMTNSKQGDSLLAFEHSTFVDHLVVEVCDYLSFAVQAVLVTQQVVLVRLLISAQGV